MAKRRANGEGNIRKRKDGRWEGRYTAGRDPETGKPIYKNVLGKTQAEVKDKLKLAIEKNNSTNVNAGQYTIGQWLDRWMENYAKLQVRPSSLKTYQGFIDNHINPGVSDAPLDKLTTMELHKGPGVPGFFWGHKWGIFVRWQKRLRSFEYKSIIVSQIKWRQLL